MQISKGGVFFFDSGIGGLTVLAECRKRLPYLPFYYYGDNKNAPYGNKSETEIIRLTKNAFRFAKTLNPVCAVVACNTVTALCIDELRKVYPFPVVGVEPALLPALKLYNNVCVLSTYATYRSQRFQRLCDRARKRFPNANLTARPCPNLAGEIEKHILNSNHDYTPFLPPYKADAIVLGCTHYTFIKSQIQRFYSVPVFDGNYGVANRLLHLILAQGRDEQPLATPKNLAPIFFLGDENGRNKQIYEQMFAKTNGF